MMTDENQELLSCPIASLGFSGDFKARSREMGFDDLRAILRVPPQELISREGFSYSWLGELTGFMQKNKLLHLMQPMPGNIAG